MFKATHLIYLDIDLLELKTDFISHRPQALLRPHLR